MNLVKLIEAVKKQSNIYKNLHVDDEEYGKEWQKVAKELQKVDDITAEEALDQWNVCLLEYMEYLRGNRDFALAKHMDFLQPYLFTILEDDVDEEELSHILADDGDVNTTNEATPSKKTDNESEKCSNGAEKPNVTVVEKQSHIEVSQIKQEIVVPKVDTTTAAETKPATPPSPKTKITQSDASFSNLSSMELIFLGYAKQLQKMPLALQLQTKRKIADVMDEAELKMMEAAL